MGAPFIAFAALAGFQMFAGYQQAELIQAQGRVSQKIGDMNAKYTELDAYETEKFGLTQSSQYASVIDTMVGQQKVKMADKNIDVNFGTAKELQEETQLIGFLNQAQIQSAARTKARGLRVDASNMRLGSYMQGIQTSINAGAAVKSGIMDAARTSISGYAYK